MRNCAPPVAMALRTICFSAGGIFFHDPETILTRPCACSTAWCAAVAIPLALASVPISCSSAMAILLWAGDQFGKGCTRFQPFAFPAGTIPCILQFLRHMGGFIYSRQNSPALRRQYRTIGSLPNARKYVVPYVCHELLLICCYK